MWNLLLVINSVILSLVTIYFIYSIGAGLILGAWKQLLLAFFLFVFFALTQIALAAINQS
ncbi:MAG: hypothetical protein NUV59_00545 [Patescibacteria group bacterium]|nr:hypothetical protein [Patescibacteria group bacterium]